MRCTCVEGFPQSVRKCRVHGQRTSISIGTPDVGAGVPVVDLTTTVKGLRDHAGQVTRTGDAIVKAASETAGACYREASYLRSLADTLDGKG